MSHNNPEQCSSQLPTMFKAFLMASLITFLKCKDHAETEVLAWLTDTPFCDSSKCLLISCVQKSEFGE
jgi:hypothetical protein